MRVKSFSIVDVFVDGSDDENPGQAKINWGAIGSVSIARAKEFHREVGKAIRYAERLNGKKDK
jgi:hypothetical protein